MTEVVQGGPIEKSLSGPDLSDIILRVFAQSMGVSISKVEIKDGKPQLKKS